MKNNENESLTPRELIKKHMDNPDSVITDESIRNLEVGIEGDKNIKKKTEKKLEEIRKETGDQHPNSLSILSE